MNQASQVILQVNINTKFKSLKAKEPKIHFRVTKLSSVQSVPITT